MSEHNIPPRQEEWEKFFWGCIHGPLCGFVDGVAKLKQLRREHYRCAWLDEARRLYTESHAPNGDDDYALWAARHAAEAEKIAAANAEATYWEAGGMEHDTC